ASARELRQPGYEVAVDFQGAVRTALLARRSGASVVYGDIQARENIAAVWYTRKIAATGAHVVEQALSLAEAVIQGTASATQVEFPVDPIAEERIDTVTRDTRCF